jgi:hypothetical protein
MSGAAAESSNPASVGHWVCGTAAVSFPTAPAPWPGARAITSGTGWTAVLPTSRTSPCSAEPITGRSMRAAGDSSAGRTGASPPPHHIEDTAPPPEPPRAAVGHARSRWCTEPTCGRTHPRPSHRARQQRGARPSPTPVPGARIGARTSPTHRLTSPHRALTTPTHRPRKPRPRRPGCCAPGAVLETDRTGDQDAHDLAGTLADLQDLGVAVEAGDGELLHVAVAAVDLDGVAG